MRYAIGIDVGVTNIKSVCVTEGGEILHRDSVATEAQQADWPGRVKHHVRDLEARHGAAQWVGLAAPGLAAPDGSCIAWMRGRLDEVQGLDWSKLLGRGVPVLNDAQAALLGEVWQGTARGSRNAMLLTLGTGVGGALLVDGRLLRGHIGRAGHLGHVSLDIDGESDVTGAPGTIEWMIGNYTVEQRSGGRFKTTHDLVAAHRAGDGEATRVWLRSIRALGAAIASLINVADPEVVIIGGGIATAGEALFNPLNAELERFEWRPHGQRVRVIPAALGEHAGALGAAYNAILTMKEKGA